MAPGDGHPQPRSAAGKEGTCTALLSSSDCRLHGQGPAGEALEPHPELSARYFNM